MPNSRLSEGDTIEGRCTACRKNTNHHVLSLADNKPAEVKCDRCQRTHQFRPPTAPKKVIPRRSTQSAEADRKQWASLRPGMNDASAIAYSMTTAYKVNALINHPVFGLGLVQRIAGAQKVEILFEDGRKTMRCK